MKFTTTFALVFCTSVYIPFAVSAAYNMKPGLWENSFTIKSQSGKIEDGMYKMQAEMAKMPAEKRKMLEGMMSSKGMGMGGGGNLTSVRVCISKEQAENMEIPQKESGNCTHKVVKRTANSTRIKFSCAGEPSSTGEGEFTLNASTAYTGKTTINSVSHGKVESMDMNQKGKWLSADCGNIKPIKSRN